MCCEQDAPSFGTAVDAPELFFLLEDGDLFLPALSVRAFAFVSSLDLAPGSEPKPEPDPNPSWSSASSSGAVRALYALAGPAVTGGGI